HRRGEPAHGRPRPLDPDPHREAGADQREREERKELGRIVVLERKHDAPVGPRAAPLSSRRPLGPGMPDWRGFRPPSGAWTLHPAPLAKARPPVPSRRADPWDPRRGAPDTDQN